MAPVRTQSAVNLTVEKPVAAKVDASIYTLPDTGPLLEIAVAPVGRQQAGCKVAVIEIDGLLLNADTVGPYSMGDNPVAVFQERLAAAAADPAVKAVVLRINSPGGSVAATEVTARSLADFRRQTGKPVVASVLDKGTGGAYYLASGCDRIVAMPSSVLGGIGVILNLYNLELGMENFNLFALPIKAGDRIDMGTPVRKMTPEEKGLLTAMAKEYHGNFMQAVLRGRPKVKADAKLFDGRIMSASRALEEGLIDAVGFLPDALEAATQLAKAEGATAVMYRRQASPARSLYEIVPNTPMQVGVMPLNVPGLDRSRLPLFLYLWQAEPTLVNK
jgi:protease-4